MNTFQRIQRHLRQKARTDAQLDALIAEQASDWVETLRNPGLLDRYLFARWLKQNERHAIEYLSMEAMDRALGEIDSQRQHDVAALLADSSAEVVGLKSAPSLTLPRSTGEGKSSPPLRSGGGLGRGRALAALTAAASVAAVAFWYLQSAQTSYTTAIGEQRSFKLTDGSLVNLNTHSRLDVRIGRNARDLHLIEGEAFFTVARDAKRPFRVVSGDTTIRALGTQFNVYRSRTGTEVAVLEGKVEVSRHAKAVKTQPPVPLSAGEEARVSSRGVAVKRTGSDTPRATAWQQRRLFFRLDTLEDIAAEFNRYNSAQTVRVEGEAARTRRFSGVFDADDPGVLAQMLAGDPALTVSATETGIVITSR